MDTHIIFEPISDKYKGYYHYKEDNRTLNQNIYQGFVIDYSDIQSYSYNKKKKRRESLEIDGVNVDSLGTEEDNDDSRDSQNQNELRKVNDKFVEEKFHHKILLNLFQTGNYNLIE